MLTEKQNALEVINWGNPEYIPLSQTAVSIAGYLSMPLVENPISSVGVDPFGINWLSTSLGPIPDTSKFMFDDITEWKKYVKFPDIDNIDFTEIAQQEQQLNPNYNNQLIELIHVTGIFERLAAFMGFENALIALITEKEACHEFFAALTDYKIKVAHKLIDAYKPDVYINFDDIANYKSTFMSPELYRELIKPYHKKLAQEVIKRGVIFGMHTCGCCEAVVEDYIDIGAKLWHSAQIMNDLPGLQKRVKGRLTMEGGWNSQGRPGYLDTTEEEVRAEIRRCVNEYGKNGGFIIWPLIMNENGIANIQDSRVQAAVDELMKIRSYK